MELTDSPTPLLASTQAAEPMASPPAGSLLGRYVVLAELGRGGMGLVVRAFDPKLQRDVAVKVMQGDALTEDVRTRMVREARAMARLSDPHVVSVYDIDFDSEAGVLLAMECIDGTTLGQWLRARRRSWREIVEVFVAAGRGLAAAHGAGVLHRDFKPSNVLVAEPSPGRSRVVKVGDFGLARAQDGGGTGADDGPPLARSSLADPSTSHRSFAMAESLELTNAEAAAGTPSYMSPEQHAKRPLDGRSDQFAFCVALWEALVGAVPYGGRNRALAAAKDAGPPPWPASTRVPRRLVASVRRGLAPDPADRWPHMNALLAQLEASLSWRTRATLVIGAATTAAIASTVLTVAARDHERPCQGAAAQIADAWDGTRREAVAAAFARDPHSFAGMAGERVERVLDAWVERWKAMHRETCEATVVRKEQSTHVLDLRMACLQGARDGLAATTALLADADAGAVRRADSIVDGLPAIDRCADLDAVLADIEPPQPEIAAEVAEVRRSLAGARSLALAGRHSAAGVLVDEAVTRARGLGYAPLVAEALQTRADVPEAAADTASRRAASREAFQIALEQGQTELAVRAASSLVYLDGLDVRTRPAAFALADVGFALAGRGGFQDAEARLRADLGAVYLSAGRFAEAEAEMRAAIDTWAARGRNPVIIAHGRSNLATTLNYQGRHAEAVQEARAALQLIASEFGPDHPEAAQLHVSLGAALTQLGHTEDAEAELRRAIEVGTAAIGAESSEVISARINLGAILGRAGRHAEAAEEFATALEVELQAHGEHTTAAGELRNNLGFAYFQMGDLAGAEAQFRLAITAFETVSGREHYDLADPMANLAEVLASQGREQEGIAVLERLWSFFARAETPAVDRGEIALQFARALWRVGDRSRAMRLRDEARALFVEGGEGAAAELAQLEAWCRDAGVAASGPSSG